MLQGEVRSFLNKTDVLSMTLNCNRRFGLGWLVGWLVWFMV